MDGILSIKKIIGGILICLSIISCQKNYESEQKIISDNFLLLVDTIPYSYGSLRPMAAAPGQKLERKRYEKLSITVVDSVNYIEEYNGPLNSVLKVRPDLRKSYSEYFSSKSYENFKLDSAFPKKIDRYNILLNEEYKGAELKYVGKVQFSNLRRNGDKISMIVILSVRSSVIAHLVLLKFENNKWKLVRRELLFVS